MFNKFFKLLIPIAFLLASTSCVDSFGYPLPEDGVSTNESLKVELTSVPVIVQGDNVTVITYNNTWGTINGTLANQVDLQNQLVAINSTIAEKLPSANVTTIPTAGGVPEANNDGVLDEWVSRTVSIKFIADTTVLTTGNGSVSWIIPAEFNGWSIVNTQAVVYTASSSGLPTFNIYSTTNSSYMLSTNITIDVGEKTSETATTPSVINPTYKVVYTGYEIRVDTIVAGTGTKGGEIRVTFRKP